MVSWAARLFWQNMMVWLPRERMIVGVAPSFISLMWIMLWSKAPLVLTVSVVASSIVGIVVYSWTP